MSPSNTSSTYAVTGSAGRYINANNNTSTNIPQSSTDKNKKAEAKALASARTQDFINHGEYSSVCKGNTKHRTMTRNSVATKIQDFDSAFNTNTASTT
ncbi:hypothetical protein B0J14DRAFT_646942 [Halenospora varia]|nr:hypothetical protein B0J14DRAFT_646942 [Halenospora varia]